MPGKLATAAFGGASVTLMWQALRLGLILVSVVTLARLLPPAAFGLIAMVTALVSVGDILRDFGLSTASIQARSVSKEQRANLFWLNTLIGVVLTLVVYLLAHPIADLYGYPELIPITQWLAFTFVVNGMSAQFRASINRQLRFNALGVIDVIPQFVGLGVAVFGAIIWQDYRALIAQQLTIATLGLILAAALAGWLPSLPSRRTSVRRFVRFGSGLLGTQLTSYIAKNIDTVAIGLASTATVVGLYGRAYQLVLLPLNQLTAPLSRVAIPILAQVQDDDAAFGRYVRSGQFVGGVSSGLIYGAMAGLAFPLVDLLLGPEWVDAVPLIQILALGGCFRAMGQAPYWMFVAKGRTGAQFRFYLVSQPLLAALIAFGVFGGAAGVAAAGSIGYMLFWYAQCWWAGRSTGIPVGRLIANGSMIFATVPLPLFAIGVLVVSVAPGSVLALAAGMLASFLYLAVLFRLVPYYRTNIALIYEIFRQWRQK
jgi:O-antigen/teichoic acid export membrane protein